MDIQVTFRDEGPAFPKAILPRVFERFFRGDPARNPGQGGGGLGLTIAQDADRGPRRFHRPPPTSPGGAEFTLRLPREASS